MTRRLALVVAVLASAGLPLGAYIGPGAGFAFLSSFLVLFLTFVLALFSLLSWPFRFLWRAVRGRRAYGRSVVDRLVILGLDGLEPSLVERFMAEGKLPHLAKLKKTGSYARLRTTVPAISPVAWSSFMTGCEPSKHNIFDFLDRDPRTYLPGLSSARIGRPKRVLKLGPILLPVGKPEVRGLRRSVPFWKLLGERGVFSTVLRVPITFPPERFRGHLLSGMCAPDLKGSQGTFSFYTDDEARARKFEGGLALLVAKEGDLIRSEIRGPENSLRVPSEELRLPLTISLDRQAGGAWIEVPRRERFFLKARTFSPWVPLAFKAAPGIKVRGMARFFISSLEKPFEMYMTPLNIDPEKPALPISHPFIYSVYLAKLLGRFVTLGEANDTWALNEGVLDEAAFLELAYAYHDEWEGLFWNALAKTSRGLVVVVFETTDSVQHMFFRYFDKTHPALKGRPARMSASVIEDLYARMDGLVGRVAAALGPRDALLVMSDHGFKAFRRGVNLNSWLKSQGYLALVEGAERSDEWFKGVDWSRTRAYALGLGGLYLNLAGREAQGIVAPGREADSLKAELKARLSGLKDGPNGPPAIRRIYDRDEIYRGPYRDNAPDLIIGYAEGYRASWAGVTGIVDDVVIEDNAKAWSGDHCIDPELVPGVLFSSLKLATDSPSIMDIAPTALELFGLAPPAHMDGRVIISSPGTSEAPSAKRPKGKSHVP